MVKNKQNIRCLQQSTAQQTTNHRAGKLLAILAALVAAIALVVAPAEPSSLNSNESLKNVIMST